MNLNEVKTFSCSYLGTYKHLSKTFKLLPTGRGTHFLCRWIPPSLPCRNSWKSHPALHRCPRSHTGWADSCCSSLQESHKKVRTLWTYDTDRQTRPKPHQGHLAQNRLATSWNTTKYNISRNVFQLNFPSNNWSGPYARYDPWIQQICKKSSPKNRRGLFYSSCFFKRTTANASTIREGENGGRV